MVISLPNMRHILILKQRRVSMKYNNTKIVNAFAGPGAGKTTACLEILLNMFLNMQKNLFGTKELNFLTVH